MCLLAFALSIRILPSTQFEQARYHGKHGCKTLRKRRPRKIMAQLGVKELLE